MRTGSWSINGIETGQIARMCRLAWFYTGGKDIAHLVSTYRLVWLYTSGKGIAVSYSAE